MGNGELIEAKEATAEITARPQVALSRSTALLKAIGDVSPDPIYAKDVDGRFFYANLAVLAIIGKSADEVLGHTDLDIHSDLEQAAAVMANDRRIMRAGIHEVIEETWDSAELGARTYRSTKAPLYRDDGSLVGIMCLSADITERKKAEQATRESEERLRLFVENAPAAVAMFDTDMRYLVASRRWCDDYGLEGPIVNRSHYELFPELPERWKEIHRRVLAGEHLSAEDDRFERLDGTVQHLRWEALPWRTARGEIGGLIIAAEDVTARKQAENALRASQERLNLALSAGRLATWDLHLPTKKVVWNDEQYRILGYEIGKVAPSYEAWAERLHPEDRERTEAEFEQALKECREYHAEFRSLWPDGTVRWMEGRGRFHRGAQGQAMRAFGVMMDITERKRTEQALRKSEERFSAIVASAMDAIIAVDAEHKIVLFNTAAEIMFGCKAEELIGASIERLIPERFHAAHREHIKRFGADGATTRAMGQLGAVWGLRANGEGFPIEASISQLALDDGRIFTVILRDITERVRAETALKDADRRKDEFLATLAHELRNPLAPIRNGLHLLRKAGSQEETAERVRSMMERQVDHLVRLVDDLLEISRITSGKIELRKERADLAAVVADAVEMNRALIDTSRLDLRVALPDDRLLLDGDPIRLTQIFANLLNNAAKYTDPGGRIEIAGERAVGHAVVSVVDTGVGIPKEMLPHVFSLFAQAGDLQDRFKGGLGIGLALVRNLVELHGGSVEAHSEGEGRGARFVVRLPLSPGTDTAAPRSRTEVSQARASRRVLIVDDMPDVADSLALLLESLGANVRVANSGAEGLAACAEFAPDMVFLDIGMPGMDGFETAGRMREMPTGRKATLVALTGWGEETTRKRVKDAGFDRHITKPADIGELEALLKTTPFVPMM